MVLRNAKYSSQIGCCKDFVPERLTGSPLSVQLAAPWWQKYPWAAFALLTRARTHTHARTDRLQCLPSSGRSMEPAKWCLFPLPRRRVLARVWWMRRSPGLSARAQIEALLKNGTVESMWSVLSWAPSNSGERSLAPPPLSLSVSRYSAGNKLVLLQPNGHRFISWPSIPIQQKS